MAIERPKRCVLLHHKGWYQPGVFRLPTGGIEHGDRVEDALHRELAEETGLRLVAAHFLGLLECQITHGEDEVNFHSYVFHLSKTEGQLRLPETEDITEFRAVPIPDLPQVAEDLRRISPPRTGWGRWRAIAHDFVHEKLMPS
ncbi:MAG: NUDIX domain-containing protein [Anaerolineales bacterium]|nr:NUDIX domain-containing protein [Anaerolineales bacterium]